MTSGWFWDAEMMTLPWTPAKGRRICKMIKKAEMEREAAYTVNLKI